MKSLAVALSPSTPTVCHSLVSAYALCPLAVSLIRFSTPKQADGDSYRRQLAPAKAFCGSKGWELDLSLHEKEARKLAASAFRGDQIRKGALGKFIAAVEGGKLPKNRQNHPAGRRNRPSD